MFVELRQPFPQSRLLRFLLSVRELPLIEDLQRFLNGTDGVEQTAVSDAAILCGNRGRLGADETFLLQTEYVLAHRVLAHLHRLADGAVAGMALVGVAVLAPKQVGVDRNFFGVQVETEDFVGHFEIALVGIAFGPALVHQFTPPVCCSTHWRNFSLGTTMRLPTRIAGKSFSFMSS